MQASQRIPSRDRDPWPGGVRQVAPPGTFNVLVISAVNPRAGQIVKMVHMEMAWYLIPFK